jgi:hypothetical protein
MPTVLVFVSSWSFGCQQTGVNVNCRLTRQRPLVFAAAGQGVSITPTPFARLADIASEAEEKGFPS